jgi:hypothetical protein
MTEPDYRMNYARTSYAIGPRLITPEEANLILTHCNNNNRKEKPASIAYFVRQIRSGQLLLANDAIAFDPEGNLLNGQNRLRAIGIAGIAQIVPVALGCPIEAKLIMDQGEPRTLHDRFEMERQKVPPKAQQIAGMILSLKEPNRKMAKVERNQLVIDYYYGYQDGIDFVLEHFCPTQFQIPILAAGVAAYFNGYADFLKVFGPHFRKDVQPEIRRAFLRVAGKGEYDLNRFQRMVGPHSDEKPFYGSAGRLKVYNLTIKVIGSLSKGNRVNLSLKDAYKNLPFTMPTIRMGTAPPPAPQRLAS